jgi:hypothetical protein
MKGLRKIACLLAAMAAFVPDPARAAVADSAAPAALRARFDLRTDKLIYNQFRRPLTMDSKEGADTVSGEIHAIATHPFASARAALIQPAEWCELLLLHLNTKYCRAGVEGTKTLLHVNIGAKHDQSLIESYRVDFDYEVAASRADYFQVNLSAEHGPMGTRGYRIALEATPAPEGKTYLHLSYSYSYGVAGRIAMLAYLASAGRDKVGFSLVGKDAGNEAGTQDGGKQGGFVGGMRGVVERNTMRYYLAIEAYLGALSVTGPARQEKSLRDWFAAVERFPRQLHEMESADYLAMKRREYSRQRGG